MTSDNKHEVTEEYIAKMIDIAIYKFEIRFGRRVKDAILANNQRILEQLIEAGVINRE